MIPSAASPHPDPRHSFYETLRAIRRRDDTHRLIREADQIVEARFRVIDERAARARWARRQP